MVILLNTAMMPNEGIYSLERIDKPRFCEMLLTSSVKGELDAYIGYPQTAEYIRHISGVPLTVRREAVSLQDGDEMLICKLKYRMKDPAKKGENVPNDFEYFYCQYSK